MKSIENAIKPTQKPICFSVQELLQRYKSNSKDSVQTQSELFQTVQTDNRSLEAPESIILDKNIDSGQESTELTIRQQQVEELPLQSQNDVIMQINHLHSIFKYLQTEDPNSKISTKTNSQHSIIKSKDIENRATSIIQTKNVQCKNHSRISIRNNQPTRQNNGQQSKSPSYQRTKSPLVSARPSNQTPKLISKATPSQSPLRTSKENIYSQNLKQIKTDHSGKQKPKEQHHQSYVVVDFTKCPSQRVLIKQDINRPSMNVQLSLKSLMQKGP